MSPWCPHFFSFECEAPMYTGWWFGTCCMTFHSVGNNNPNWRTPSFFRGVGLNHQPVIHVLLLKAPFFLGGFNHVHLMGLPGWFCRSLAWVKNCYKKWARCDLRTLDRHPNMADNQNAPHIYHLCIIMYLWYIKNIIIYYNISMIHMYICIYM